MKRNQALSGAQKRKVKKQRLFEVQAAKTQSLKDVFKRMESTNTCDISSLKWITSY